MHFRRHKFTPFFLWFGDEWTAEPEAFSSVQLLHNLGFRAGFTQARRGTRNARHVPRKTPIWYRFGQPVSSTEVAKILQLDAAFVARCLRFATTEPSPRDTAENATAKMLWAALRHEPENDLDASLHVRVPSALISRLETAAAANGEDVPALVRGWLSRIASDAGTHDRLTPRGKPVLRRSGQDAALHVRLSRHLLSGLQMLSARRGVPINESVREWITNAAREPERMNPFWGQETIDDVVPGWEKRVRVSSAAAGRRAAHKRPRSK